MTSANAVLWRRLRYMLTPQFDIYANLHKVLPKDGTVLEVGFGTGFGVVQYLRSVRWVDAIEIDRDAIDFAEGCFRFPHLKWMHGDIAKEPPHLSYSAAVMIEVLEHIADWESALKNVAAKCDMLVISHRNANAELRKNDLHEREWTAEELVSNLHKYFPGVTLMDYTLEQVLDTNTRQTPLIAVARLAGPDRKE